MRPLFRRLTRDARLWLTIAALVIGAAALAAVIVWQGEQLAARERAATHWYAHTLEVLVEVGAFSTALSETLHGARGYLLTRDPQFLSSYQAGVQATPQHLRRIQALTIDNPGQQRRLAMLASDAAEVVDLSQRELDLETAGSHTEALALVGSQAANAALARVQATSSTVMAEEQRLLTIRRAAAARATAASKRIALALSILGAGLLVGAGGLGWVAFAAAARAQLTGLRAEANNKQASTAALLSLFIDDAPAAIAMFDREMRYLAASRRYAVDYGLSTEGDLVGRSHYDIFPELPQGWREIHARVLAGSTESREEDAFPRADGRVDWVHWRMQPWRNAQGEIGGALLFSEVVTAQVESHRAHLAAEARLRAIVESAVDAIVVFDELGAIESANPATETLFGYSTKDLLGRSVFSLMPEPDRSSHEGYLANYLETGERTVIGPAREVSVLRNDGSIVPVDLTVADWRVEGQRHFTALMRDATPRKNAEAQRLQAERRELVVGELRHRISNIFAVIESMVMAGARSHHDVGVYRDALRARISAFAATQVALAQRGWADLSLRELIEFELSPYAEEGRPASLQGAPLVLNSTAAECLAIVIHELATNAAKYGALSRPDATLEVRWRLTDGAPNEARLVVDWIERGGPLVMPPKRRGFGSTVIETSARALGGAVQLNYAPEGLSCALNVPAVHALLPARASTGRDDE